MNAIENNIQRIMQDVGAAAIRSGRKPEDICVVAVCKKQPIEKIHAAVQAGIENLAENYPEQALDKMNATIERQVRWHMIGHIQSRKVKLVADYFDFVHSVDSISTLIRLNDRLVGSEKKLDCLLEINVAQEANKSGFTFRSFDNLVELDEVLNKSTHFTSIIIRGLMVMPPFTDNGEDSRTYFKLAKDLLDVLQSKHPQVSLDYLSMGTSQDYLVAIQEGSTHVRIGTAIFGSR